MEHAKHLPSNSRKNKIRWAEMHDQTIGLCGKPRFQIWTHDVSYITRNVQMTSRGVHAVSDDIIVKNKTSERYKRGDRTGLGMNVRT